MTLKTNKFSNRALVPVVVLYHQIHNSGLFALCCDASVGLNFRKGNMAA